MSTSSERADPPRRTLAANLPALLLLTAVGGLLSCAREVVAPAGSVSGDVRLIAGLDLERTIAPGDVHRYRLLGEVEQFLHLVVEQEGVDLGTTALDRDGAEIVTADRPIADTGREPLLLLAAAGEPYSLEVRAWGGEAPPGRYRLVVAELHPAGPRDRLRFEAASVFAAGEERRRAGQPAEAVTSYRAAVDLWRELDDPFWEAEALDRLGKVRRSLGELGPAADDHLECVEAARRAGDVQLEAMGLTQAGAVLFALGELDEAVLLWNRALPLYEQVADRQGQGIVLHDLAHAYQIKNRVQDAIDHYARATELWQESDLFNRAHSLHNLGVLNQRLGRSERALDYLREARAAWERLGERQDRRRAATLSRTAEVYLDVGQIDDAQAFYEHALSLRRGEEDRRGEASTLAGLARVHQARGDPAAALEHYQEALTVLGDLDRPRSKARIELRLGQLYNRLGHSHQALAAFGAALPIYRKTGDRTGEAECLLGIAAARRRQGDVATALEHAESALTILESVRPLALSDSLRAHFFATVQHHYEAYIDLLMELHATERGNEYLARALLASERSRSRSLVDLLAESGAEIRHGADAGLLTREHELQERINEKERERLGLLDEDGVASRRFVEDQIAAIERQQRELLERLEAVRAQIRANSPRYADLTQPTPLSLDQIQQQVLDPDSLLLEYRLGEARSYLWLVSDRSVAGFELPPRRQIETTARQAYELLTRSLRREGQPRTQLALCELSRQILGPVAGELDRERLLIVSDGALDYIPFAALPHPSLLDRCPAAPPLIEQHDVTYLPSASALSALRREPAGRPSAVGVLAVVADPVFNPDDPRLTRDESEVGGGPPGERSVAELPSFRRLPATRLEAEAILALVPAGERSQVLLGLEANKTAVVSGALTGYDFVHFATHGVLNSVQPELSGIALSMVDASGRPRDGFLRSHEIYNLELPSELVVLSACQTALGREVRGEGLIGMTRGLMYAGAKRVMVSLWNVGDSSTAVLMEEFYRGLLERGLRPSTALREAQLAMRRDKARSAPYHWASFVLQGEWR